MAKTGRPKSGDSEGGTTQLRVFDAMAEQITDLLLVLPLSTAQIIQRVGGANLKELHETHLPRIEKVKAARKAAEEAQQKARAEATEAENRSLKGKRPRAES